MIKILKIGFEEILEQENYLKLLEEGNFYEFEELLYGQFLNLYNKTVEHFVRKVSQSESFKKKQKELGKKEGLKKLVKQNLLRILVFMSFSKVSWCY